MRNGIVLLCSIFISFGAAYGQVLVQDASNTSSIVYQGTTINVDAAQTRASFSINRFTNESFDSTASHLYWGVQASADSKNGLATFLKTGSIVPNANFRFTLGKTWTKNKSKFIDFNRALSQAQNVNEQISSEATEEINRLVFIAYNKLSTAALKDALKKVNETNTALDLPAAIASIKTPVNPLDADDLILEKLKLSTIAITDDYIVKTNQVNARIDSIRQGMIRKFWLKRYVLYGIVEGSASKFTFLANPTQVDYSKRFVDTTFEAPRLGIGFNKQIGGKSIWGFTITHEKADNFLLLTDKEFTITNTDQVTNTTENAVPKSATTSASNLASKKTFTGYEGNYKTYWKSAVNIDYVHFFPGKETDKATILWHAYLRQSFSWFRDAAPHITKIGTGLYTFRDNGTFIGGLYIELDDTFNNLEKQKSTPDLKPFYRRLSLGIVTKLALNSIISYR